MKPLVLGGTKFVGRAVVETALARGHEVMVFNRGRTNPALFPEAEHLRGDREGDLPALAGRSFDAVVDPSGYRPEVVRASVEALAGAHYLVVSSISAYAGLSTPPNEVRSGEPTYIGDAPRPGLDPGREQELLAA